MSSHFLIFSPASLGPEGASIERSAVVLSTAMGVLVSLAVIETTTEVVEDSTT